MDSYYLAAPFAILSALSTLSMILIGIKVKTLRSCHTYKYTFILFILEFFWAVACLFPIKFTSKGTFCTIQGILNQFFNIASILWIGFISLQVYLVKCRGHSPHSKKFFLPLLFILFLSFVSALIPAIISKYSLKGPWCWIHDSRDSNGTINFVARISCYFAPLGCIVIWVCYSSYAISKKFDHKGYEETLHILKLRMYPIIMLICYIPVTIISFFDGTGLMPQSVIIAANSLFILEGLFDSIVYGLNRDVSKELKKIFCCSSSSKVILINYSNS